MILAAHQPHFLPWLGYFEKMRQADLFILVDHVQFERQNFQNRTSVKTGEHAMWITVPVQRGSREEQIVDKRIDNHADGRHRWGRRLGLTLKYAYQGAPYFADYAPRFLNVFDEHWEWLVDLNTTLIDLCRDALDIRTPMLRSSEMKIAGAKSEMVLNMCREVGADVYLSGSGASRHYLDVAAFEREGIDIIWQDFTHPRYPQHPGPDTFIEKLSAFDLLVNCGPRSGETLFQETLFHEESATEVLAP